MKTLPDLSYGPRPHQALDLILPGAPRAVVIYAHGGGFTKGSRKETTAVALAAQLAPLGIAVVSVSYRLGGTLRDLDAGDRARMRRMMAASARFGLRLHARLYGPAFACALLDLGQAVAALRTGAVAPDVKGLPITILGMSAGGIAALSLAHPPRVWAGRLAQPDAVLAVSAAMVQPWCLRPGGPPCVMLHGPVDRIISPQDARLAATTAQDRRVDLLLIVTDTPGHVPQLTRLIHGTAPDGRPGLSLLTDLVARTGVC
ncbi:MAG: carboxylesterase family protein [Pseudotabrizicola sp.]|uniref:alpha/beta hydrolase n=1 Tax=Pseudotabrizicola sp. TaxID=2939647 RepID=UPI0027321081|nr:carboxylesterase family protein [Pseudotabrizicola sp.]MDP2080149.1 carboxylesterase family protein [Pseudotabrizicola sp.]MDZ7574977.1 carboxylesterase family protein [Pseudotabrizicola sp.]